MADLLARGRGLLLHVGSPASYLPWPGSTAYAAARWALRGLHQALEQDLRGTGVHSCHVVFGKVSSGYFAHNPGAEERIPRIGALIPVSSPEDCARVLLRVIRRPRGGEVLYPFMLRAFAWVHWLAPRFANWLAAATSTARHAPRGR
jgi:short-subunit dehydrogenase